MSTLLKFGFWFGIVLFMLPLDSMDRPVREVSPLEAAFAAKGAIDDAQGLCTRRPDVCATGSAILEKIGLSARDVAREAAAMLEDWYGTAPEPAQSVPAPAADDPAE